MATYVYKYVHPNYEWLYVGKADNVIKDRIVCHSKEFKFQPFLKDAKIYFIELDNKAQSKFVESYLIDKYKPHLNVVDKYDGESTFTLNLPEWKIYKGHIRNEIQQNLIKNDWYNKNDWNKDAIIKLGNELKEKEYALKRKDEEIVMLKNRNAEVINEEIKKQRNYFQEKISLLQEQVEIHKKISESCEKRMEDNLKVYELLKEHELLMTEHEKIMEDERLRHRPDLTMDEFKSWLEQSAFEILHNYSYKKEKIKYNKQFDISKNKKHWWKLKLKTVFCN